MAIAAHARRKGNAAPPPAWKFISVIAIQSHRMAFWRRCKGLSLFLFSRQGKVVGVRGGPSFRGSAGMLSKAVDDIVAEWQRLDEIGLPPKDRRYRPSDLPKAAAAYALA